MTIPAFPINTTHFDPAIAPSMANTPAFFQETHDFPAQIRVHNTLKNSLLMSYWTCIAISHVGIYDMDVRDLPRVKPEQAEEHSKAIRTSAEAQRAIALQLIWQAFPNQAAMLAWLDEQDRTAGSAIKLHHWKAQCDHLLDGAP